MSLMRTSMSPSLKVAAACKATLLSLLSAGLCSCGLIDANIFDTTITVSTQEYAKDFGSATGTVPVVPCTSQTDTCSQITPALQGSGATAQCDTAAGSCIATASLTLPYTVNLSNDQAFMSGVSQKVVQAVRSIDLAYGLPVNTLTFDIPSVDVYVGPQNAMTPNDPGVLKIGTIGPFKKSQPIPDRSQHLMVADPSPARDQLVHNLMNPKVPFVFLLASSPTIKAGDQVPAGKIELRVTPSFVVGLPR